MITVYGLQLVDFCCIRMKHKLTEKF